MSNILNFKDFKCSSLLFWITIIAISVFIISLILNFNRCSFIDIFISLAFFSNVFVFWIFNFFLMIRLISFLLVSVLIDIVWEY